MSDNGTTKKPKLRLRLTLGSGKGKDKDSKEAAKPKPKVKVKVKPSTTTTHNNSNNKNNSKSSTAASGKKSSNANGNNKNKVSSKPKASAPAPVATNNSRGKELPAAVKAARAAKKSTASANKKSAKKTTISVRAPSASNKSSNASSAKNTTAKSAGGSNSNTGNNNTSTSISLNIKAKDAKPKPKPAPVPPMMPPAFAMPPHLAMVMPPYAHVPMTAAHALHAAAAAHAHAHAARRHPTVTNAVHAKQKKSALPQQQQKTAPVKFNPGKIVSAPMTAERIKTCMKVMNHVKRRHASNSQLNWFLKPITDVNLVQDYRNKIRHPCDIQTITHRLKQKHSNGFYYKTIADFVLDLRRIFANALIYNTTPKDKIRNAAIALLEDFESILSFFIARAEAPNLVYPPLLYNWKQCVEKLDIVLSMKNRRDGLQTAFYFLYPVSFYFGGNFPADYLVKIKPGTPMDFGTIVNKLLTGDYQSVGAFAADCRLTCENCKKYHGSKTEGAVFVEQAERLLKVLGAEVGSLVVSDQQRGVNVPNLPPFLIRILTPTKALFKAILKDLRNMSYTSRISKVRRVFSLEKSCNTSKFKEYIFVINLRLSCEQWIHLKSQSLSINIKIIRIM